MNIRVAALCVVLCCSLLLWPQNPANVPFAGCYEVVSQVWHPMNEDASPIPGRFQLLKEPMDNRSSVILQMRSLTANHDMMERLWFWQQERDGLFVSWGNGLGGFRGSLKQDHEGEFVGKVKEWCDSRCGLKRRTVKIRIRKNECGQ